METSNQNTASRLNALNGLWNTKGKIWGSKETVFGTDSYEWVAGGSYLMHRVDVTIGKEKMEAVEIIESEEDGDFICPMYSFDNNHQFETMQLTFERDNVFKITGDSIRAILTIEPGEKHMEAFWERLEDGGKWKPWMEMKFDKIARDQHIIAIR